MSREKITHKELLTFSNLTNLEWEFVDLEGIASGEEDRRSTQLNDLLNPEVFQRIYKDDNGNEIRRYIYGEEGYDSYNQEQGLAEMRQKAGIAMEYLEKSDAGNNEGDFLGDWEVIYGADKYKIVADYLDGREHIIRELARVLLSEDDFEDPDDYDNFVNSDSSIYNDREFYEELRSARDKAEKRKVVIKYTLAFVTGSYKVARAGIKASAVQNAAVGTASSAAAEKTAFNIPNLLNDFALNIGKKHIENEAKEISAGLAIFMSIISDPYEIDTLVEGGIDAFEEYLNNFNTDEERQDILDKIEEIIKEHDIEGIEFIEEIDMYDEARYSDSEDEFRVLALKKDDDIVIAYKGKEIAEDKVLPEEFDCLQMIYTYLTTEHPEASIHFTGFKGGGQLAFLNALLAGADNSYVVEAGDSLSKISLDLFGDPELWRENIFRDENDNILSDGDIIHPGDIIKYCPAEVDSLKATIFTDSISSLENCISFTKENMDSTYEPLLRYTLNILGGTASAVAVSNLKKYIFKYLGNTVGKSLVNCLKAPLLKAYTMLSTIFMQKIVMKIIPYLGIKQATLNNILVFMGLAGIKIAAAIKAVVLFFKLVLVVVIIALILYVISEFFKRWSNNTKLSDIYNWLISENYIVAENGRIEGYISDLFMRKSSVTLPATHRESGMEKLIEVNLNLGLYMKYKLDRESRIYSLSWDDESDAVYFEIGDHQRNTIREANIAAKLVKNDSNLYEMNQYIIEYDDKTIEWDIKTNVDEPLNELIKEIEKLAKRRDISNQENITSIQSEIMKINRLMTCINVNRQFLEEELKEDIQNFGMMTFIMGILGDMQRTYTDKADDIFEFIYPGDSQNFEISYGIPDSIESPDWTRRISFTEYAFLPFVDEETGNIADVLREDYIASVFRSSLVFRKELYHRSGNLRNRVIELKFDSDEAIEEISYDFNGSEVNQFFLNIFNQLTRPGYTNDPRVTGIVQGRFTSVPFYNAIRDIFNDNPEELEKYYHVTDIEEVERRRLFFLNTEIDGIIDINPESETNLEYKYNPDDYIVGGELKIEASRLHEDTEETEIHVDEEPAQEEVAASVEENSIDDYSILAICDNESRSDFLANLDEELNEDYQFLQEEEEIDESEEYLATEEDDLVWDQEDRNEDIRIQEWEIENLTAENRAESFNRYLGINLTKNKIALAKSLFDIDLNNDTAQIVDSLGSKIQGEKKFQAEIYRNDNNKKVVINYLPVDEINKVNTLLVAMGIPNEEFDRAEKIYRQVVEEKGEDYNYTIEGYSIGGTFAQYAGIMSEGHLKNYQIKTYNAMGLEKMLKFNGNEFLGYKIALTYSLNKIFHDNESMDFLLDELYLRKVIQGGNITKQYRNRYNQTIKSEKLKKVLISIYQDRVELSEDEAVELVEKNFNPLIIERKMRLIDKYQAYQARIEKESNAATKQNAVNFLLSNNIAARLFSNIGSSYFLDHNLKAANKYIPPVLIKQLEEYNEEEIEDKLVNHQGDNIIPFLQLKEGGNGERARNVFRSTAKVGNITNNLSLDYLQSLIKDIVLDLKAKDPDILLKLFTYHKKFNPNEMLEVIKDRLRYSMLSQKKLEKKGRIFKSTYFIENPDLLSEEDKTYSLDEVALEQIEKRITWTERKKLYKWEVKGEGIYLVLCEKDSEDEDALEGSITYHSSDSIQKFDNEEERLKLELDQPSQNKIYGSLRKAVNYNESADIDYHYEEEDAYNFSSNQGVGFTLFTKHKDPERRIKIDGNDIAGEYPEKDREDADIGDRTKTLRDTYFGDNIILRDRKSSMGELSGDLIYIYGPEKKDQLIIEGFTNGDYGIELNEKASEASDDEDPITYTDYKVYFDAFEFLTLKKLDISKTIDEHTKVYIKGIIDEEKKEEYSNYLNNKEDPPLVINYDNDDSKLLFKGIIDDYEIRYEDFDYTLEIEAVSYSVFLDRERKTRIFQNQGTTYNDICDKLSTDNEEFHIYFADSSEGDTPLLSEDYPIVMQYKESDWQFLKRIASYLDKIIIVDDCKDDGEAINIQIGFHSAKAFELNNANWSNCKKTGPRNTQYIYHKVYKHEFHRSEEAVFEVGKKCELTLDHHEDLKVEMEIIKNRIYFDDGILYADINLAREEDIHLFDQEREFKLSGRSYRGEVMEVNDEHQVKVKLLDIEDDFEKSKAYLFPIDNIYTDSYFAPELGDIVDLYFAGKNEKDARIKSSTSDEDRELNQEPEDKEITTPGNYTILLNDEEIYLLSKNKDDEEEAVIEIEEDEFRMKSSDNRVIINEDEIKIESKNGQSILNDKSNKLSYRGNKIDIANGKIKLN